MKGLNDRLRQRDVNPSYLNGSSSRGESSLGTLKPPFNILGVAGDQLSTQYYGKTLR